MCLLLASFVPSLSASLLLIHVTRPRPMGHTLCVEGAVAESFGTAPEATKKELVCGSSNDEMVHDLLCGLLSRGLEASAPTQPRCLAKERQETRS